MIPYDDLVAALSAWRARQGLPVSALGGAQAGSGPTPTPGSGPTAKPSSGGTKAPPPPLEMHDEEVGDAEMLEEQYETEGSDFAMPFNAAGGEAEATAIGGAPERPTDENMSGRGRGGNGRDDW